MQFRNNRILRFDSRRQVARTDHCHSFGHDSLLESPRDDGSLPRSRKNGGQCKRGWAGGTTWAPKPIVAFPQKFYREEAPLLLDLTATPDVKFIRAHWEVARWG